MPIYVYKCPDCKHMWENMRRINDRTNEECGACKVKAAIVITAPARPVVYDYYSENLGAYVTGPKQKKELMRKKGMEERG